MSKDQNPSDKACDAYFDNPYAATSGSYYSDRVTFYAGFAAGAASRDAEVQRLQMALADAEALELGTAEKCDQLRAHINMLRDAFQTFIDEHEECQDADEWMAELCSIEALHVAGEVLASTPEQSLAEYRNKVIEECATRCDPKEEFAYSRNYLSGITECAEAIRAMKDQP